LPIEIEEYHGKHQKTHILAKI